MWSNPRCALGPELQLLLLLRVAASVRAGLRGLGGSARDVAQVFKSGFKKITEPLGGLGIS